LRDRDIADHIGQTLTRVRDLYAEVVRRWQAVGEIEPSADPSHVGAVLMGIVHAFAIQRLLLPGTRSQRVRRRRPRSPLKFSAHLNRLSNLEHDTHALPWRSTRR